MRPGPEDHQCEPDERCHHAARRAHTRVGACVTNNDLENDPKKKGTSERQSQYGEKEHFSPPHSISSTINSTLLRAKRTSIFFSQAIFRPKNRPKTRANKGTEGNTFSPQSRHFDHAHINQATWFIILLQSFLEPSFQAFQKESSHPCRST